MLDTLARGGDPQPILRAPHAPALEAGAAVRGDRVWGDLGNPTPPGSDA